MGAFRYAQTGNRGWLPSIEMPNTFAAQAFDAGDPCSGGGQCCMNSDGAGTGWACHSGEAGYTGQFMGGIHPRVKKIVGTRLAKAARAMAYNDTDVVWTGPVLDSCTLVNNQIRLRFQSDLLKSDSIMVLPQTNRGIGLLDSTLQQVNWDPTMLALLQRLGGESPMEVQMNNETWLPVAPRSKCMPVGDDNVEARCQGCDLCNWNATTSTHTDGFDEVVLDLGGADIASNITAVRYAWGENPCCPGLDRSVLPCPPNSCPIQTWNSTMPAVPFWATIVDGKCSWVSTKSSPPPGIG